MNKPLIIGTRGSELALWQAYHTQKILGELGIETRLEIISTKGDQIQNLSFDKIEGKGFFTKEIEQALMDNTIDIAVHSHKDLETAPHPDLIIAAVSHRADPRDLLITKKALVQPDLPLHFKENCSVGTSSVRRKTQIKNIRPDASFVDIRGNVPTRIQKLRDGQCDALMLAAAGIERLDIDLSEFHVQLLDPTSFVPAPAQGVLGWQCRRSDTATIAILEKIHHADIQATIAIERTLLQKMEGGCQLPLGVYCTKEQNEFHVHVAFSAGLNEPLVQFEYHGNDADTCIAHCFDKLKKWQEYSSVEK